MALLGLPSRSGKDTMKHHFVRSLGVLVTTGAVAAAGLSVSTGGPASAVAPGADPSPSSMGAAWLAGTVPPSRILRTYYVYEGAAGDYEDFGLTIDAATALTSAGGSTTLVSQMTDAVEARASEYTNPSGTFYASNASKLAAFLLDQGRSGAAVDAVVQSVRDSVSTTPPTTGRIQNSDDSSANTIGQAFAVHALAAAGPTDKLAQTQSYLLAQQCSAGFFRESFAAASAPDQTCDGANPAAQPSVDMTALAIQQLQPLKADPLVSSALTRALSWLRGQQRADGSFGTGGAGAPNANSTGLAGTALGVSGEVATAQRSALWIRGRQLANAGPCGGYASADNGAVVLDNQALTEAGAGAMNKVASSSAVRATGQALPALTFAPGGPAAGETTLAVPEFAKPKIARQVAVTGAPGNTVCLSVDGANNKLVLDARGSALLDIMLPRKGRTTVTSVDAGGETDATRITVLRKKNVTFDVKKSKLAVGAKAVVKVRGLKPGESVKIKLRGKTVDRAEVNKQGKKTLRFKVKGKAAKPGKATLKVVGQYGYRHGQQTVRITR